MVLVWRPKVWVVVWAAQNKALKAEKLKDKMAGMVKLMAASEADGHHSIKMKRKNVIKNVEGAKENRLQGGDKSVTKSDNTVVVQPRVALQSSNVRVNP